MGAWRKITKKRVGLEADRNRQLSPDRYDKFDVYNLLIQQIDDEVIL